MPSYNCSRLLVHGYISCSVINTQNLLVVQVSLILIWISILFLEAVHKTNILKNQNITEIISISGNPIKPMDFVDLEVEISLTTDY